MSGARAALAAAALAVVAILIAPFLGLALSTPWAHLALAPGDSRALAVSLGYTGIALAAIVAFGTPLAYWLARTRARLRILVEVMLLLALFTPPLALGILLALFFGPYGPVGRTLGSWGLALSNSPPAFVMAQFYAALPYYVYAARVAFDGVPRDLEEAARTLGCSAPFIFARVTFPLAALGLAAAVTFAWVRALGEFGVVLIVAYFPQGIPVKLWVNLQDYGLGTVYPLLWLFFAVALPLPLLLGVLARRRNRFA